MVLGQIWVSDYFCFCFDQKIGGKQIFNGRHLEPRTSAKVVSEKQKKRWCWCFLFLFDWQIITLAAFLTLITLSLSYGQLKTAAQVSVGSLSQLLFSKT